MGTKKNIKKSIDQSDWKKIQLMKDEDIDVSDDPVMPDAFWTGAEIRYPDGKTERVSMRIKPKVLNWFKKNYKKGYQTQIHNVLESYIESKVTQK